MAGKKRAKKTVKSKSNKRIFDSSHTEKESKSLKRMGLVFIIAGIIFMASVNGGLGIVFLGLGVIFIGAGKRAKHTGRK